ncbi:hypothetical protein ABG768_016708 [Culter alburnus]|uniref:Cytochrome P450 2J6-like n=1 Tax=Culter alburnus TaxID=194366 RepID=A0AAW1Z1I1_CULAL
MWTTLMKLDLASVGLALFLGLIFLVLFEIIRINSYRSQTPPGPRPLPFVGSLPQFLKNPMEFVRSMSQYGEMSTMYLGRKPVIILNTIQVTKEALVQETFSGRPVLPLIEWITNGLGIIMVTFGHSWRQQRRFALHTLRNFGLGKKSVEDRVLEESRYLISEMLKEEGLPFDPQRLVTNAVANIISGLVFGHRFEYDDHQFHLMQKYVDDFLQLPISHWGRLYNEFPTLMSLLPGKHQTAFASMSKLQPFMQEEFRKHKEEKDPSNPRDYIDCYLDEIEKCKDSEAEFTEENLMHCVVDLFGAGTETTSNTLRWALLFMIKYPDVQDKVQSEIDQVIGQTRQPLMDDRTNLPYTYAVIHEIQRFANIVTFTPPRVANKDTTVGGQLIPKGVIVMPLLKTILQDKNEYSTPYEFNPAHFLDENGMFLKKDSFIPFSIGKRMCPGEQLARMELFLFFISLMQRFTFLNLEGQRLSLKGSVSVSSGPEPFQIRAVPR